MVKQRISQQGLYGAMALMFAISTVATVVMCRSMAGMGGDMRMPGCWTMSMVWMLMPDQTLLGALASFMGMWVVMMPAMMAPSLAPMLVRYREVVSGRGAPVGRLTTIVGAGYFFVWTAIGAVVFAVGFWLSTMEMQHPDLARAVPLIVGVLVVAVGAVQLTSRKAHCLACCREVPDRGRVLPANVVTAWTHGLQLGLRCVHCCFGLMLILVAVGVMDLRLMAVVTAAVTAERLASNGLQVARVVGCVVVVVGLVMVGRAVGLECGWLKAPAFLLVNYISTGR